MRDLRCITGGGYKLCKRLRNSFVALALFLVSGLSAAASSITDSLQFRILFPVDSSAVRTGLFDNAAVLSEFSDAYNKLSQDDSATITGLTVCGSASAEGNYEKNINLANKRALAVCQYLQREYSIPDSLIKDVSTIPAESKLESILSSFPETLPGIDLPSIREIVKTTGGLELKRAFIKIDGRSEGTNWTWFKKNILEPTRFAEISLFYDKVIPEPDTVTIAPVMPVIPVIPEDLSSSDSIAVAETVPEVEQSPEPQVLKNEFRLGTNLLYDAATVANLTFEYGFNRHMAVTLLATFSPWDIKRPDVKIRTLIFQPEFRWYFADNFKGHYVGVEGHYGWWNVALGGKTRYQDRDGNTPLWGAGISYGYVLPINEHWGMDFGISAGYAKLVYDCFYNVENGAKFTTVTRDWWGPTKVGISIHYQF